MEQILIIMYQNRNKTMAIKICMEKSSFGVRGGALAAGAVSCRTIARFKSKSRCDKWVKCLIFFIVVYFMKTLISGILPQSALRNYPFTNGWI